MPVGRRPTSTSWAAVLLVLLAAGLVTAPVTAWTAGPGTPPNPAVRAPTPTVASPLQSAAERLPDPRVVTPAAVITSLDWDGMGLFSVPSVNPDLVAGEGAAMVSNSQYRTIVLFGGRGSEGLTNLTLEVSQTTGHWKNVTRGYGPSPRANMSFADDAAGRLAVLFGGTTNPRTGASDNSTWVFWYGNQTWENVTHAVRPPARESAAFAVDPSRDLALLEGGWDRSFVSGGSTGTVTWNDTWTLNLTTFVWTPWVSHRTPPPMFGSAMDFDPLVGEFEMFGGCNSACTNAVEAVDLTNATWHLLVPPLGSQVPAPGAGSDFAWSPLDNASVMFGGFGPTTSAYSSYNSTFVFDPLTHLWSYVQGPPDPFARYAAAATWLSANGCPGLFLAGGSSAFSGPPPDLWFLDPNPDTGVGCNIWGNDQVGNSTGNGTGGCNGTATLTIVVADNVTHAGIANASIALAGGCGPKFGITGANGVDVLTRVPETVETIKVSAVDYHPGGTVVNVTQNYTANRTGPVPPPVWVNLTSVPSLRLRSYGDRLGDPKFPLGAVAITMDDTVPLGNTSADGFLNLSGVSAPAGRLTFSAYKAEYTAPRYVTQLPYTGIIWVNLTLQAAGLLAVEVLLAGTANAVSFAAGTILPLDPGSTGEPIAFRTNLTGEFALQLPLGNYSVGAGAPGYFPNRTIAPVFHPWVATTYVQLNLTPDEGYNLSVQVRDSATHLPILNASVELGFTDLHATNRQGWANFSDLRPPGVWGVGASAPGYESNQTTVFLDPSHPRASVTLLLTPIPCVPPGCAVAQHNVTPPFSLLPTGSAALTFLLAAPAMFLVAAVGYAVYLRRGTAVAPP